MSHLSLEELARLLDEPATEAESSHLALCSLCRDELEALRGDRAALGELPDFVPPPPEGWESLETRLREEGLILSANRRRHLAAARLRQLAAAVAIFLLGGIAGFGIRGIGDEGAAAARAAADESKDIDHFAAARALEEAEAAYRQALARYVELSPEPDPLVANPVARLEVLEQILSTTRSALSAAPADPLINGYYLTAQAQRDATVRQLTLISDDRWY